VAHIQSHQSIALPSIDEADIFASMPSGQVCIQVFFLRAGQIGNRACFPAQPGSQRTSQSSASSAGSTKRARHG
jgi:excinuclease ABC subunit C